MAELNLTPSQLEVVQVPLRGRVFLEGLAGTGKTTVGVERLRHLIRSGIPADRILVLVPQRTLGQAYYDALRLAGVGRGGLVSVATMGGLARRMIDLFWPLVAETAGFAQPDEQPVFLTMETAQYYMARVVDPLIAEAGYFESLTMSRNRLYSQILDNLNNAAVVGFPITEIAERLKAAWMGEQAQANIYENAETCALHFRAYCYEHNLLDFSLQMEIFVNHLWENPLCREHLVGSYPHIIADNVEEDSPVATDVLYTWLPDADSALIIFDEDAGYRSFLGADPYGAQALKDICDDKVTFTESFVMAPAIQSLSAAMDEALNVVSPLERPDAQQMEIYDEMAEAAERATLTAVVQEAPEVPGEEGAAPDDALNEIAALIGKAGYREAVAFRQNRFQPQMLEWVADEIAHLVHEEGVPPGEIVVLSPTLTDALRFALMQRLTERDVPAKSHRPSRALRDEPATQTLLTLTALTYPEWGIIPARYDVAYALMHAIAELDLVRAQLLTEIVYRVKDGKLELAPFDGINPEMQERITFLFGGRYETLRTWLQSYRARRSTRATSLDHFLARLFGEVLSQPGFGFHEDIDSARVASVLVESVRKFRWVMQDLPDDAALGKEYLTMVREGVIAAQYLVRWRRDDEDAVFLAPAYTFLVSNRSVDVQFWLNVGGHNWWDRLYQPVTHPYVLSRRWPKHKPWTDADEFELRQRSMRQLVLGLIRRCRRKLYLGLADLSEQGFEQDGALLHVMQRVLRHG